MYSLFKLLQNTRQLSLDDIRKTLVTTKLVHPTFPYITTLTTLWFDVLRTLPKQYYHCCLHKNVKRMIQWTTSYTTSFDSHSIIQTDRQLLKILYHLPTNIQFKILCIDQLLLSDVPKDIPWRLLFEGSLSKLLKTAFHNPDKYIVSSSV